MDNPWQQKIFRNFLMMENIKEILNLDSLKIGYQSGKSKKALLPPITSSAGRGELIAVIGRNGIGKSTLLRTCLLYTSDAADEEDSVDLGGRRIMKKKKEKV